MGIELPLAKRRQQRATDKLTPRIGELLSSLCPVDARPYNEHGLCPTCGKAKPASSTTVEKPTLSPEEQKQAELREQFYARYDRLLAEREAEAVRRQEKAEKKEKPTSVVEQAKAFVGPGGRALF